MFMGIVPERQYVIWRRAVQSVVYRWAIELIGRHEIVALLTTYSWDILEAKPSFEYSGLLSAIQSSQGHEPAQAEDSVGDEDAYGPDPRPDQQEIAEMVDKHPHEMALRRPQHQFWPYSCLDSYLSTSRTLPNLVPCFNYIPYLSLPMPLTSSFKLVFEFFLICTVFCTDILRT